MMEQQAVREDEILGPTLECIGQIGILLDKAEGELLGRDPAGAAKTMADIMQRVEDILEILFECETAEENQDI